MTGISHYHSSRTSDIDFRNSDLIVTKKTSVTNVSM